MPPTETAKPPRDLAPREGSLPQRRHECAAWHYPGTNGGVRDHGRRGRGDQGAGHRPVRQAVPRGRVHRARLRLPPSRGERWSAAPDRAHRRSARRLAGRHRVRPTLPEVDPARVAIWGFSLSGGHIFPVAARNPRLAAAIAQTPNADGPAAAPTRCATEATRDVALHRPGLLDALGGLVGREPLLVPLAGEPGTVALLTTPDALDGDRALNPDNRYPDWQQEVAARSALRFSFYRPGRDASRVRCPLLVLVCDQDQSRRPARRPRRQARAPRRARPHARRALRALPRRPRTGRRGRAVIPAPAPARAPAAARTRQIELSAGTIDYEDTGGDGPTIVLLHGLMMDASLWEDVIADLSADHRCVAPTLPLGAHRHAMHADADLSLPGSRGSSRSSSTASTWATSRSSATTPAARSSSCSPATAPPASAGSCSSPATRSTTSRPA